MARAAIARDLSNTGKQLADVDELLGQHRLDQAKRAAWAAGAVIAAAAPLVAFRTKVGRRLIGRAARRFHPLSPAIRFVRATRENVEGRVARKITDLEKGYAQPLAARLHKRVFDKILGGTPERILDPGATGLGRKMKMLRVTKEMPGDLALAEWAPEARMVPGVIDRADVALYEKVIRPVGRRLGLQLEKGARALDDSPAYRGRSAREYLEDLSRSLKGGIMTAATRVARVAGQKGSPQVISGAQRRIPIGEPLRSPGRSSTAEVLKRTRGRRYERGTTSPAGEPLEPKGPPWKEFGKKMPEVRTFKKGTAPSRAAVGPRSRPAEGAGFLAEPALVDVKKLGKLKVEELARRGEVIWKKGAWHWALSPSEATRMVTRGETHVPRPRRGRPRKREKTELEKLRDLYPQWFEK